MKLKHRRKIKPYFQTKLGKIYCCDCLSIIDKIGKFDMVFTDPDYKVQTKGGNFVDRISFYNEVNKYSSFDFLKHIPKIIKLFDFLIFFHSKDQIVEYSGIALSNKMKYDLHVLHKSNPMPFVKNTFTSDLEYISIIWKNRKMACGLPIKYYSKYNRMTIGGKKNIYHPNQKPKETVYKYLKVFRPKKVLDPFMGSGTVPLMAEELGIEWVGIEKEKKHCKTAVERLRRQKTKSRLF